MRRGNANYAMINFVAFRNPIFSLFIRYRSPQIVYYCFANASVVSLHGKLFSDGRSALRAIRKHLHTHTYVT